VLAILEGREELGVADRDLVLGYPLAPVGSGKLGTPWERMHWE
jgi:hypothetical protein